MELPDMITRLPEADLPYPATAVKTSVLQSEHGQLVFFQIFQDVEIPAHSHKGQWGTVLEGEVELTIGGASMAPAAPTTSRPASRIARRHRRVRKSSTSSKSPIATCSNSSAERFQPDGFGQPFNERLLQCGGSNLSWLAQSSTRAERFFKSSRSSAVIPKPALKSLRGESVKVTYCEN